MALNFQGYPGAKTKRQQQDDNFEQLNQGAQGLASAWANHKLSRLQQDLALKKAKMELEQHQSEYGTGEGAPTLATARPDQLQPGTATPVVDQSNLSPIEASMFGTDYTPPTATETPEERLQRIGTKRYEAETGRLKAEQEKPAGSVDAILARRVQDGTMTLEQAIEAKKSLLPQTTVLSPTGQTVTTVAGKTAVLPQPTPEKELGLTPGQVQTDKEFGKDYEEFTARGGYADVQKNLEQLKTVADKLKTGEAKTGLFSGLSSKLPNTKARDIKENVQEVVQRNLRLVLGAQFTEREGAALISRAYNEYQSPQVNQERLSRLIKQIDEAADAKRRAGEYFEKKGTLKGYKGTLYTSPSDFLKDDQGSGSGIPQEGGTFQGAKVLRVRRID